ncbi:hypothetical protein [Calothrix rhizosoleniae]|uniref:hypothetical protein n=1 Tax=Calothrix rhizosoleniae TaxID=888997 RepID=UPI000B49A54A|nr:hypothetical protein [Calothrix rhizosoleniae]
MTYSAKILEQREREKKSLKTLLEPSFVASLALHIILLAYGIIHLIKKVSLIAEPPIEITFFKPPLEEEIKPPLKPKITKVQTEKLQSKAVETSSTINPNPGINLTTVPLTTRIKLSQQKQSKSKILIESQKLFIKPQQPLIQPQTTQSNV